SAPRARLRAVRPPPQGTIRRFQRRLLAWYAEHGRDLPWRRTRHPYRVLVSEIMLQQTQVDRVIPKYREFLRHYPTLAHLARASADKRRSGTSRPHSSHAAVATISTRRSWISARRGARRASLAALPAP